MVLAFDAFRKVSDPLVFFVARFVALDRGWLRADSLEELVGLDVSYHGRSTHGDNGDIKKEYIEAYNRYKGTIRHQRGGHGQNNSNPDRERLPFSDERNGSDNGFRQSASTEYQRSRYGSDDTISPADQDIDKVTVDTSKSTSKTVNCKDDEPREAAISQASPEL